MSLIICSNKIARISEMLIVFFIFQTYGSSDYFDQFKTRFFLKEFLLQLESMHKPVGIAVERIEEKTDCHRCVFVWGGEGEVVYWYVVFGVLFNGFLSLLLSICLKVWIFFKKFVKGEVSITVLSGWI